MNKETARPVRQIRSKNEYFRMIEDLGFVWPRYSLKKIENLRFGAFVFQMQIKYLLIGELNPFYAIHALQNGSQYANACCVNRLIKDNPLI